MLIFATDLEHIEVTKIFLSSNFAMKDIGEANVIIGIKIMKDQEGITLSKSHYIDKILNKFNLVNCFPAFIS